MWLNRGASQARASKNVAYTNIASRQNIKLLLQARPLSILRCSFLQCSSFYLTDFQEKMSSYIHVRLAGSLRVLDYDNYLSVSSPPQCIYLLNSPTFTPPQFEIEDEGIPYY
jgi:hypothetical protein